MNKKNFMKYGVPVIFFMVVIILLYLIRNILMPFILALGFSYIINPIITHYESKGFRRDLVLIGFYLFVFIFLAGGLLLAVPHLIKGAKQFKSEMPATEAKINAFIDKVTVPADKIIKKKPGDKSSKEMIMPKLEEFKKEQIAKVPEYLGQLMNFFSNLFLIPFISFFILLSSRKITREAVNSLAPKSVETVLSLICEIDDVLGNFIRGTLIESSCVAVLSIVGLWYLKIDYFFVLGPLAGLGNLVPYLGPVVGAIPAAIIGVIKYNTISIVVKVAVVFLIIQFLDNFIIQPIVVGQSVSLDTLEMLIVLMIGAELFGVLGMLLAVPVGASIKIALQILYVRYRESLGERKGEEIKIKAESLI